jgi:hypothetical protein
MILLHPPGTVGFVAVVLTALSLTHLSCGIQITTGAAAWEGWSMAVGIDFGFVALEVAKIMSRDRTMRSIAGHLNVAIVGTLVGSAVLNAFAFAAAASGWLVYPAVALGLAIPGLIYCLTRIGATMWIDR